MSALTAPYLVTAESAPVVNFLGRDGRHHPGRHRFLPRGLPHAFVIVDGPADLIQSSNPAGFENLMADVGSDPHPGPARLTEVARRHNIDILGPPSQP